MLIPIAAYIIIFDIRCKLIRKKWGKQGPPLNPPLGYLQMLILWLVHILRLLLQFMLLISVFECEKCSHVCRFLISINDQCFTSTGARCWNLLFCQLMIIYRYFGSLLESSAQSINDQCFTGTRARCWNRLLCLKLSLRVPPPSSLLSWCHGWQTGWRAFVVWKKALMQHTVSFQLCVCCFMSHVNNFHSLISKDIGSCQWSATNARPMHDIQGRCSEGFFIMQMFAVTLDLHF